MAATNGAFFTEQFLKPNGAAASGVRVFHYVAGNTTTNLDVYQNGNLTAPHANPVVGDSVGRVSFYGNGTYRLLVKTAADDPEYPNQTLYDWDPVELVHHTATVRAEDKGFALPAASAASRGRIFGVTDFNGDILSLWLQQTSSEWANLMSGGLLTNILQFAKGTTIASSSSVTIPNDGNFFDVTGTNSIESMTGFAGYPIIYLRTIEPLTFVHHATNLRMLGLSSRTTLANQITAFLHIGAGQWVELWYTNPFFGDGFFTDGGVLVGNGRSELIDVPLPIANRVFGHNGVTANDPTWITGLHYHGPTSTGSGSTRSHSGNVTITGNVVMDGLHFCTNFTLNAGLTISMGPQTHRLIIYASDSITINGAIAAAAAGVPGGFGTAAGSPGTDQPGGGGSGGAGGAGGSALLNGVTLAAPGTQVQVQMLSLSAVPWLAMGGAGGGGGFEPLGGESVSGGAGGASIVLIAPTVTLGPGCVLNTSGGSGATAIGGHGGGGGGAGNIYILTRNFIDNGATYIQLGGGGGGTFTPGNNGQAGVRQVNIYG
jgi:hypothetical protein